MLLVVVDVGRGVRRGGRDAPGVVVGNVSGQATDGGGLAGILVDVGEEVSSGLDVGGPAEPASVASVEVHSDVGQVELLEGVDSQLLVGGGRAAALLDAHVGHHVGQGIGLNDQEHADIRVGDEVLADGVDVGLVVGSTVRGNSELAVGGGGSAVTVGKIIDDNLG